MPTIQSTTQMVATAPMRLCLPYDTERTIQSEQAPVANMPFLTSSAARKLGTVMLTTV